MDAQSGGHQETDTIEGTAPYSYSNPSAHPSSSLPSPEVNKLEYATEGGSQMSNEDNVHHAHDTTDEILTKR
jgi:hypothetical protein